MSKKKGIEEIKKIFSELSIEPEEINGYLDSIQSAPLTQKQKLSQLVLRPSIGIRSLVDENPKICAALNRYKYEELEQAEIQIKYEVYIEKEKELVSRMSQMEELEIPNNFDYAKVQAISAEAREKLRKIRPGTLGQASRISGINPSDVQILMVYMGR